MEHLGDVSAGACHDTCGSNILYLLTAKRFLKVSHDFTAPGA
jgi:hypothetical protein